MTGEEELEIPEGTQSGQIFRKKGKGLPNPHGGRGDLYIVIHVVIPSKVTREQKRLLEQLELGAFAAAVDAFEGYEFAGEGHVRGLRDRAPVQSVRPV